MFVQARAQLSRTRIDFGKPPICGHSFEKPDASKRREKIRAAGEINERVIEPRKH